VSLEVGGVPAGVRGRGAAGRASPRRAQTVRSLDAIHLGTALHVRSHLTSFITYDKRLADAARAAGLPVDIPS
jgi:predicted nucleic acid-binding protein